MIASLFDVKRAKNIDVTKASPHDPELVRLLVAVENFICGYCWRTFDYEPAIVEYFSGRRGEKTLLVNRPPIVTLTSLYDDPLRIYDAGHLIDPSNYAVTDTDAGVITLDGLSFLDGVNNIKVVYAGGFQELASPSTPVVNPQGTPGATAYSYKVTALGVRGETEASLAGSTASGAATLNGTDFNRITWAAVTGALGYKIYKTVPSASKGFLRKVAAGTLQYDDTGQDVPDTTDAPTENRTGVPNDLRQAAVELVWTARDKGDQALFGVRSKSIADGNIAYLNNDWPAGIKQILDFYSLRRH